VKIFKNKIKLYRYKKNKTEVVIQDDDFIVRSTKTGVDLDNITFWKRKI